MSDQEKEMATPSTSTSAIAARGRQASARLFGDINGRSRRGASSIRVNPASRGLYAKDAYASPAPNRGPQNNKMQQTSHGQNGGSLLILVFGGPCRHAR